MCKPKREPIITLEHSPKVHCNWLEMDIIAELI